MHVMKLGIMQPYFLPYIGYFQLINFCDEFILYDNIKYTKKGWINRNKIQDGHSVQTIQLPLKTASDTLEIGERYLANNWHKDKERLLNRISSYYKKAPNYKSIEPLLHSILNYEDHNLYSFLKNSIYSLVQHLGISTNLLDSSKLDIDHTLKSTKKIIALCKKLNADEYVNSIGGKLLYDKALFSMHNINLRFIKCEVPLSRIAQHNVSSHLSILDTLMYFEPNEVKNLLDIYSLE